MSDEQLEAARDIIEALRQDLARERAHHDILRARVVAAEAAKPAPLRVLEVEIDEAYRKASDPMLIMETYAVLRIEQEFPADMAGKRVRCVIEEVG